MITFLSSPKPFVGIDGDNQIKAVTSWVNIDPHVEVIIYGKAKNAGEVCHMLGARYVPEIESSPSGLPYFNAIAEHARTTGKYDIQIYLNCDILLSKKVLSALKLVTFDKFLVIGQRIDLAQNVSIKVDRNQWTQSLTTLAASGKATLHGPTGKDYFIFPRGLWKGLPSLIIGRGGYDSALMAFCLRKNIPIIDATFIIPAFHLAHKYKIIKGKKQKITLDAEAVVNSELHDIVHSAPTISDASWRMEDSHLERNRARGDWFRYFENWLRYRCRMKAASYFVRAIWRLLTKFGIYRRKKISIYDVIAHYRVS